MIVKIQMPLSSSEKDPPCFVYNKDKSIEQFFSIPEDLKNFMRGRAKAYFYTEIDQEKRLVLKEEAPWQSW